MHDALQIGWGRMSAVYLLLLPPLAILLWQRVPIIRDTLLAVLRMTVQLLFVGFYLQVVFDRNNPWLNLLWLVTMVFVADGAILRGCRLHWRRFALPLGMALLGGTALPMLVFVGLILQRPHWLDAQYAIPISGMILGNCLRADIIGLKKFYETLERREKIHHLALAQGATLEEALRPGMREALQAALLPTVATMATIGLVSLPGMMTGVILGGANPMTAIQYQIAIMVAIYAGTSITVFGAIRLTRSTSFDAYGLLDRAIFRDQKPSDNT